MRVAVAALVLGGCAPLFTGLVGFWKYATQGYFISKTGEVVSGPAGMVMSGVFVAAGMWMIAYALWYYPKRLRGKELGSSKKD